MTARGPPRSLSEVIVLELKERLLVLGGEVCPVGARGPQPVVKTVTVSKLRAARPGSVGMPAVRVEVPVDPSVPAVTQRGAWGAESRDTRAQEPQGAACWSRGPDLGTWRELFLASVHLEMRSHYCPRAGHTCLSQRAVPCTTLTEASACLRGRWEESTRRPDQTGSCPEGGQAGVFLFPR